MSPRIVHLLSGRDRRRYVRELRLAEQAHLPASRKPIARRIGSPARDGASGSSSAGRPSHLPGTWIGSPAAAQRSKCAALLHSDSPTKRSDTRLLASAATVCAARRLAGGATIH